MRVNYKLFLNILTSIINAIYPLKCIVCESLLDDEKKNICADCNSQINWLSSDFFNPDLKSRFFDRAKSLAAYDSACAKVIHRFKYNNRTDLAKPLAEIMTGRIDYEYDIVIPVPLHSKKLRQRGYNQSALLAKEISRLTGFKTCLKSLKRIKDTADQVGLSKTERLKNIQGAFNCSGRVYSAKSANILLIDDVMTTGATVNECAKALKKCGAGRVDVLTLARTDK